MKRKFLIILAVLFVTSSLAACNKVEPGTNNDPESPVVDDNGDPVLDPEDVVDDHGFEFRVEDVVAMTTNFTNFENNLVFQESFFVFQDVEDYPTYSLMFNGEPLDEYDDASPGTFFLQEVGEYEINITYDGEEWDYKFMVEERPILLEGDLNYDENVTLTFPEGASNIEYGIFSVEENDFSYQEITEDEITITDFGMYKIRMEYEGEILVYDYNLENLGELPKLELDYFTSFDEGTLTYFTTTPIYLPFESGITYKINGEEVENEFLFQDEGYYDIKLTDENDLTNSYVLIFDTSGPDYENVRRGQIVSPGYVVESTATRVEIDGVDLTESDIVETVGYHEYKSFDEDGNILEFIYFYVSSVPIETDFKDVFLNSLITLGFEQVDNEYRHSKEGELLENPYTQVRNEFEFSISDNGSVLTISFDRGSVMDVQDPATDEFYTVNVRDIYRYNIVTNEFEITLDETYKLQTGETISSESFFYDGNGNLLEDLSRGSLESEFERMFMALQLTEEERVEYYNDYLMNKNEEFNYMSDATREIFEIAFEVYTGISIEESLLLK